MNLIDQLTGDSPTIDCACGYLCVGHKKVLDRWVRDTKIEIKLLKSENALLRAQVEAHSNDANRFALEVGRLRAALEKIVALECPAVTIEKVEAMFETMVNEARTMDRMAMIAKSALNAETDL